MTAEALLLDPARALALLAGGLDDTEVGILAARPVLVLDLRAVPDPDLLVRLGAALAGRPCVIVGVADSAIDDAGVVDLLDVALCDEATPPRPWVGCRGASMAVVDALVARIAASPEAAVALVQLLRSSEHAPVVEAVVAESFVYSLLQGGRVHREWLDARATRQRRPRPDTAVVEVAREGNDLTITLDRPEVRNAYGHRMRDELVEALRLVAADPTIEGVTLRGRGPSFSAGGDLDEFGTAPLPLDAHFVRTTRNAGIVLSTVADRVTARVHGPCVGAGVELPSFAARVIADRRSTFLLPEIAMGLVPGAGGTASIPRRIGRHRTAWFALSGEPVDATVALDWGLVDDLDTVEGT